MRRWILNHRRADSIDRMKRLAPCQSRGGNPVPTNSNAVDAAIEGKGQSCHAGIDLHRIKASSESFIIRRRFPRCGDGAPIGIDGKWIELDALAAVRAWDHRAQRRCLYLGPRPAMRTAEMNRRSRGVQPWGRQNRIKGEVPEPQNRKVAQAVARRQITAPGTPSRGQAPAFQSKLPNLRSVPNIPKLDRVVPRGRNDEFAVGGKRAHAHIIRVAR